MKKEPLITFLGKMRIHAEGLLSRKKKSVQTFMSGEEIKLLHELEVHKIELEMQYEELKKVEEKEKLISIKYFRLYNVAPLGYFTLGPEGTIYELNESGCVLLCKSPSEAIHSHFRFFISQTSLPTFDLFFQKIFSQSEKQTCEVRFCNEKGPSFFVHLEGIISEDKKSCHLSAVDMTKSHEIQETVHENFNFLETVINTVLDGITLSDVDGQFEIFNKKMEEISGYTKEEVNVDSLFIEKLYPSKEEQKKISIIVNRLLSEGGINQEETQIHSKSGNIKSVLVATSVVIRNNKPFVLSVYHDITEKKEIESQYRQLMNEKSLGRMAGAIAHKYNNILAAVMGSLELAMEDYPLGVDILPRLQIAMKESLRAAEVSNLMLTYLGHKAGKQESLDFSEVCQRSLHNLSAILPSGISLESKFPTPGPRIWGNEKQIDQVLSNLVENAVESMGSGVGKLILKITTGIPHEIPFHRRVPQEWHSSELNCAYLEVTDNGCGVNDKELEALFEPFYSSKFTGRGLGLAVVLGIARSLNGHVTVESLLGKGSTFRFFLPVIV